MSGERVDVIGVLSRAINGDDMDVETELMRVRAAVAGLIEADKSLDAIDAELPCAPEDMPDPMAYLRRREAAVKRRAAALSRIQPDGQGSP